MAGAKRMPRPITAEEYLTIERNAPYKSEFLYGEIYAMAGGTTNHIKIISNTNTHIGNQLENTDCFTLPTKIKVRTAGAGFFSYPDVTIVCGPEQYHDTRRDVLLNPIGLIEVLSPSSEAFDRGEKFQLYQELDSLRDYVLISQNTPRIEHYARQENGLWLPTVAIGLQAEIPLSAIPVTLSLAKVYARIVFSPQLVAEDAEA